MEKRVKKRHTLIELRWELIFDPTRGSERTYLCR